MLWLLATLERDLIYGGIETDLVWLLGLGEVVVDVGCCVAIATM